MAMNFPDAYKIHNDTLSDFINKFNSIGNRNVMMIEQQKETYDNDGVLIRTDKKPNIMGFDWEWRKSGYQSFGKFEYKKWGMGQYANKLAKPSIDISLQISTDGTGLLVAFHSDFPTPTSEILLPSETKVNRREKTTCTDKYIEYDISNLVGIQSFKDMIERAFATDQFNSTVFVS